MGNVKIKSALHAFIEIFWRLNFNQTRTLSSWMRSACSLTVSRSIQWGVGPSSPRMQTSSPLQTLTGCKSPPPCRFIPGRRPSLDADIPPLWTDKHLRKHILQKLRLRAAKMTRVALINFFLHFTGTAVDYHLTNLQGTVSSGNYNDTTGILTIVDDIIIILAQDDQLSGQTSLSDKSFYGRINDLEDFYADYEGM